jgi:hypothetical protein
MNDASGPKKDESCRNFLGLMKLFLVTNAPVVDDAIMFVTDKSSSIKSELEKHKVDDVVTVDRQHNNNDIQRFEEEDKQILSKYDSL